MRHKRIGRKLGVTTKHRKSMLRNMVTDLFRNERLRTTDTRAKEIRRVAEKMITLAKEGSLHKRRQAGAFVRDKEVLRKLFSEIAEKFKDRPGGYTRITKLGFRKGDNTPISVIELVEEDYKPKKKKKKAAPKKKTTPKVKDDAPKAKSTKKESAEELGLIEDEENKAPEAAAETPEAIQEEVEAKVEETQAEEAPQAEAQVEEKAEETPAEEPEQAPEAKAEEASEPEPAAETEPAQEESEEPAAEAAEEQIEAKAEESAESGEETPEEDKSEEADKKEE